MERWSGEERRKKVEFDQEVYTKIIETHQDVKHIREWSNTHDKADNERFTIANKRIAWIEKVAYVGIGGLAALEFITKIIFK